MTGRRIEGRADLAMQDRHISPCGQPSGTDRLASIHSEPWLRMVETMPAPMRDDWKRVLYGAKT